VPQEHAICPHAHALPAGPWQRATEAHFGSIQEEIRGSSIYPAVRKTSFWHAGRLASGRLITTNHILYEDEVREIRRLACRRIHVRPDAYWVSSTGGKLRPAWRFGVPVVRGYFPPIAGGSGWSC